MKNLYFISILAILASCQSNYKEADYIEGDAYGGNITEEVLMDSEVPLESISEYDERDSETHEIKEKKYSKKIIKEGSIGFGVDNIDIARKLIDSLVKTNNGYISVENLYKYEYAINLDLTIRIPESSFEYFIEQLEKSTGKMTHKSIEVKDVTEEFIDIEKRLENKKEFDKKYSELLKQARSIKDILEIQENKRLLQEEIESAEGRLKYLNDLVTYSTLHISLNQKVNFEYSPEKRDHFWERLKRSLHSGWLGFIDFFLFLLRLWPFWLVGIAIWKLIMHLKRKKKK